MLATELDGERELLRHRGSRAGERRPSRRSSASGPAQRRPGQP
jgi:hypothetical protein